MNRKTQMCLPLVLLAAVLALVLLPSFSLADPPAQGCEMDPNGNHSWVVDMKQDPTCTADGGISWHCEKCGNTHVEEYKALGHDMHEESKAPTCTEAGWSVKKCSRCGKEKDRQDLPATGHKPETIPAKPATCEENGMTEGSRCSVCGTILKEQSAIAASGHSWGPWQEGKLPTCEEKGKNYSVCANCGQTRYRDDIEPLGHDWDEGVVTKEAGYLEEGEITYTCKRDPSHTKTEALPVKELAEGYPSVMSLLRDDPPGAGHAQKLAIFRQPEGGVIDGGFELSVEAMGGVEPYSYAWMKLDSTQGAEALLAGIDPLEIAGTTMSYRLSGILAKEGGKRAGAVAAAAKGLSAADFGLSVPIAQDYEEPDVNTFCPPESFVGIRVGEDSPAITPDSAGIYYCVVTDQAGNHVASEKVRVNDLLYIVQQPMNENLLGQDSVTLTCIAAGGIPFSDGSYMYMWCNGKGGDIKTGNENWIEITEEGEYYCLVQDNYGDPVTSDRATVYCAEPLTVTCDQAVYSLLPGEEPVTLGMTISGGVPPYEVQWTAGFETIDAFTTEETHLTKQVSDFESYGLAAKDSMGRMAGALCKVEYNQLEIAQEPVDGVLRSDENTPYTVSIVMAEGEAPFTYTLVSDDTNTNLATGESGESYSFDIWETGTYHIHVEDAAGRWADSSLFYVDDYCFRIYIIEKSGELTGPDDAVTLTALLESAEEDVTYRWWWMGTMEAQAGAIELPENGPVCIATRPGQYQCLATNRNGLDSIATVRVAYLGSDPIILQQPQSTALPYEEGKTVYPAALSVNAIASDSRTDVLEYVWEYKVNSMWLPGEMGSSKLDLRLSDGKKVTYRCKVTDTRTGAYVISDEAQVFIDLNISIRAWYDFHWGRYDLYYDIQGGAMPYTIDFYRHQVVGIDDNGEYIYYDYLYATETVNYGQGNIVAESSDLVFRCENGQYIKEEPRAQYYYVITDSNGQTKTSETAQDPRR